MKLNFTKEHETCFTVSAQKDNVTRNFTFSKPFDVNNDGSLITFTDKQGKKIKELPPTHFSDISILGTSFQSPKETVKALAGIVNFKGASGGGGGVSPSTSDDVSNVSSVSGANVTAALNWLKTNAGAGAVIKQIHLLTSVSPIYLNEYKPGIYQFLYNNRPLQYINVYPKLGGSPQIGLYLELGILFVLNTYDDNLAVNTPITYSWQSGLFFYEIVKISTGIKMNFSQHSSIVDTNQEQTISGKKTFTALPESDIVPETDNQFTNKKYVDDNAGGLLDTVKTINIMSNIATIDLSLNAKIYDIEDLNSNGTSFTVNIINDSLPANRFRTFEVYINIQNSVQPITWFNGITWVGGTAPAFEANTSYCIVFRQIAAGYYHGNVAYSIKY